MTNTVTPVKIPGVGTKVATEKKPVNVEIKPIGINSKVKEKLSARLPQNIILKREAGKDKNGNKTYLSYISGSTVIDILNTTFNYNWNFEIVDQWIQPGQPWVNKWNGGKVEEQGGIAFVRGRLTVNMVDDEGRPMQIVKESFGSKAVIGKQSEQDSTFKAAQTDALKKCASLLGIGTELYRKAEEQEYYESLIVEPTWTEENIAKYKNQYDYITSVIEAGNGTYIDQCVAYLSGREGATWEYIPEGVIDNLVDMVQQDLEEN